MKSRRPAPDRPASSNNVTLADDPPSITDSRVRMRQRLGTIERAWILYGDAALMTWSPGAATCPPSCEYCSRSWAVVA